jgi:PAS domain S-box-containing protein
MIEKGKSRGANGVIHALGETMGVSIFRSTVSQGMIYANEATASMFHYASAEKLLKVPVEHLYADPVFRRHLMAKLKSQQRIKNERVLFRRKDGSTFWGALTISLSQTNTDMVFDGVILDISDLVEKEHLLMEKTNVLEKVNAELDRFLYSVSHDLRAPICSLQGMLNLMKMNVHDDKEMSRQMVMMEASLQKLDTFILQIGDFAKNSNQRIESKLLEFNAMIERIHADLHKHANYPLINFEFVVEGECDFYSDPSRIQLILENVVRNSFDFVDEQKTINMVSITVKVTDSKVQIEVFDNGVGIHQQHIGHVFDMFYRASTFSKGSGIGLYVAREAAIKLQGSIEIRSQVGVGTYVRIEIPAVSRETVPNRKKKPIREKKKDPVAVPVSILQDAAKNVQKKRLST